MIRIGIAGASGIGFVHARELSRAGARITTILGSSAASSRRTADRLIRELGIDARATRCIDDFLVDALDAVVVATPVASHRALLRSSLGRGLPTLAEKPLVDLAGEPGALERELDWLREAGRGLLMLNTCNAFLLGEAIRHLGLDPEARRFRFAFFTRGPHRGRAIGIDLVPHAVSLLQALHPDGLPEAVEGRSSARRFEARLRWGPLACEFDLREDPTGPRHLAFALDDVEVVRETRDTKAGYRIELVRKDDPERRVEVLDPFAAMARRFIDAVRARRDGASSAALAEGADHACHNQLALECVLAPSGGEGRPVVNPARRVVAAS